jgi:hypothetical protein
LRAASSRRFRESRPSIVRRSAAFAPSDTRCVASRSLGDTQFELAHTEQGIRCSRHKVVRGITLSREELPLSSWITALVDGVRESAQVSEGDRLALEGLLR